MNLPKLSKNRYKTKELLRDHTTFNIGGQAQVWYEPKDKGELSRFLKDADDSLPLFVIGSGSNLLATDGLIKKVFIHLNTPDFLDIKVAGTKISAGAGTKIGRLISVLNSKDLGGYEFLAGIPGTIGGALVMNAGAKNDHTDASSYREMKDIVLSVEVLDRHGRFLRLKKDEIKFSYRNSSLKPYIIVSAEFGLFQADKKTVQEKIKNNLINRIGCQDWQYPSAGSFFRNPEGAVAAGKLIDQCGLKGLVVGGAKVSDKHANFIVNIRGAKSSDVLKLMEIVKKTVYNRFKIELNPEVEIVS
jgi:UDP-N-acetylmuramate dehydrogenase